jgi:hypothetical protein
MNVPRYSSDSSMLLRLNVMDLKDVGDHYEYIGVYVG